MAESINVLYLEDDEPTRELARTYLDEYFGSSINLDLEYKERALEAFDHHYDSIVTSHRPISGETFDFIDYFRENSYEGSIIVFSSALRHDIDQDIERMEGVKFVHKNSADSFQELASLLETHLTD